MSEHISPTIANLRTFKRNPEPRTKGKPNAKLTRKLATKFCDLVAKADDSIFKIIEQNPDLPSFNRLYHYQQRVPWFKAMWQEARIRQTHFLAQKCLSIYKDVTPKTAHVARVQFDIIRWLTSKFNPETFGDKPNQAQSTVVNVGISLSPERLSELRTKLDSTRSAFASVAKTNALPNGKLSRTPERELCQSLPPKKQE